MAIFDGERARWLWKDDEAVPKPWPDEWAHFGEAVAIPGTRADGFLTPFRVEWQHRISVFVDEAYGGEETESRLRREFADRLATDPVIGPRMPSWYWEKLATYPGVTVTYNWWLLAHDIVFIASLGAIGWLLLRFVIACGAWVSKPGPGFCRNCRYDLSGLKTDRCPECGTPISRGEGVT